MLICVSVSAAETEAKCIYLAGYNGNWYEPTVTNAALYENAKLYETSPGSNVYEGTFYSPQGSNTSEWSFCFYSALAEEIEGESGHAYNQNRIMPVSSSYLCYLNDHKAGCVYSVELTSVDYVPQQYATAFAIKDFVASGVRFIVDLNRNVLNVITAESVALAINTDAVPTLETAADFPALIGNHYVPAGELKFRYYDFWNNCFCGANNDAPLTLKEYIYPLYSGGSEKFFTINNWPGGVLQFLERGSIKAIAEIPAEIIPTYAEAYAVGDFNGWSTTSSIKLAGSAESGVYTGTLPAGTSMFKITEAQSWDVNVGWSGTVTDYEDGSFGLGLKNFGDNFTFSTALTADTEIQLDFNEQKLIVKGASYARPEATSDAETPAPDASTMLLLCFENDFVTPDADNFKFVYSSFQSIKETEDGVFEGDITITADEKFRFYAGLSGKVFAPAAGICELNPATTIASVKSLAVDDAGWWALPEQGGVQGVVTVNGSVEN